MQAQDFILAGNFDTVARRIVMSRDAWNSLSNIANELSSKDGSIVVSPYDVARVAIEDGIISLRMKMSNNAIV